MTRRDVRCVTGADWEDNRKHAINQHLHPLPQRTSRVNAKFVARTRRREHGAKVGGADNPRLKRTSAKETKTSHTEESGEGCSGSRGKRQHWKRWHGGRRAQEAEAQELLRSIDSSHGSDAQTGCRRFAVVPSLASCRVEMLQFTFNFATA